MISRRSGIVKFMRTSDWDGEIAVATENSPVDAAIQAFFLGNTTEDISRQWTDVIRYKDSGLMLETEKEPLIAGLLAHHVREIIQILDAGSEEEHPATEKDDEGLQLALPLAGWFSPSKRLTDLWIASVVAWATDAKLAPPVVPTENEVKQQFSKMLAEIFGTVAQKLRYEGNEENEITRGGSFLPRYEIEVCDGFLMLPSLSNDFLALLKEEIVIDIRKGANIRGGWGYVAVTSGGDLKFVLKSTSAASSPSFVRSRRME